MLAAKWEPRGQDVIATVAAAAAQAIDLFTQGQRVEAEAAADRTLALYPDELAALNLKGTLPGRMGRGWSAASLPALAPSLPCVAEQLLEGAREPWGVAHRRREEPLAQRRPRGDRRFAGMRAAHREGHVFGTSARDLPGSPLAVSSATPCRPASERPSRVTTGTPMLRASQVVVQPL